MKKYLNFLLILMLPPLLTASPLPPDNLPYMPWNHPRQSIPKGQVYHSFYYSKAHDNLRDVWVYTPPYYDKHNRNSYPLLVVLDGAAYVRDWMAAPVILDNLIGECRLQPMVALFVGSIEQPVREIEKKPCDDKFADFLANELIPWLASMYNVSPNPAKTIIAGSSMGGLAACYAAMKHPERFGNVICQSGAFWWRPDASCNEEWFIERFAKNPKIPTKFYLDVGNQEVNLNYGSPSALQANRDFHNMLKEKKYWVYYREVCGDHEYDSWRATFPIALQVINFQAFPKPYYSP